MKRVFMCFLMATCSFASSVDVKVEGIEKTGDIYIGLYDKSQNFTSLEETYKRQIVQTDAKSVEVQFENIPDGKYAIALFQDENNNHKLDKNFLGIPKEGYGFSNNPHTLLEPTFNDAVFEVRNNTRLHVKVCY
ncbi:DUF2141 domain-containing protein [bacterium]|nr:DUF2141 domain-containing protein [bacterium]MBU1883263.1 DUF2141 domain-containing protein [bacterium]